MTADLHVANEARETRGDYSSHKEDKNKTKTANKSIEDAAYQVTLATQAVVNEDFIFSDTLGNQPSTTEKPEPAWKMQYYFPIIVTTAKLFVCEFDEKEVDIDSGEIPFNLASLTETNEVLYEYSIPKHLQNNPVNIVDVLKNDSIEIFIRKHIFVVNSQHLKSFLSNLIVKTGEKE